MMGAAAAKLPPALSGATDLGVLASIGKIAFALLAIVAVILLFAWLMRRLVPGGGSLGQHLKIVAAKAVGPKERVVIIEVESSWLVLGITTGGISKLHELPAGKSVPPTLQPGGDGFAARFASALKQNMGKGR